MFGKGQNSNSIISQLDFAIKNKQKVFHMSGGEQLRDYLHVIATNASTYELRYFNISNQEDGEDAE